MKNSFFEDMKNQMEPEKGLLDSLRAEICETKRKSTVTKLMSWVPSLCCLMLCALCVFNAVMPKKAQRLPIVGEAFLAINQEGEKNRTVGKTPAFLAGNDNDTVKIDNPARDCEGLEISASICTGLDLSFELLFTDRDKIFPDEVTYINLSSAYVKVGETLLNPLSTLPRLEKLAQGVFWGSAIFDATPIVATLENGSSLEAILYFDALMGSYDEMPHSKTEELCHSESYYKKLNCKVDISSLYIDYIGESLGELTLEYAVSRGNRLDMVYSADSNTEWVKDYNIFSAKGEPAAVNVSHFPAEDGKYYFRTVYTDMDIYIGHEGEGQTEAEEQRLRDQMQSIYSDICVYNGATGALSHYRAEEDSYIEYGEGEIG